MYGERKREVSPQLVYVKLDIFNTFQHMLSFLCWTFSFIFYCYIKTHNIISVFCCLYF